MGDTRELKQTSQVRHHASNRKFQINAKSNTNEAGTTHFLKTKGRRQHYHHQTITRGNSRNLGHVDVV